MLEWKCTGLQESARTCNCGKTNNTTSSLKAVWVPRAFKDSGFPVAKNGSLAFDSVQAPTHGGAASS